MKLASALSERSDLQNRLNQLSVRLNSNAKVQDGETPAEDPADLLSELDNLLVRLEELVRRINDTNAKTEYKGESLSAMLARRDMLKQRIRILRDFLTQASAKVLGVEKYYVLDYPDCEIEATLELRARLTRLIRQEAPNLLITHRVSDYHADHRAVGTAVRDATYLLGVPLYCPDAPVPEMLPFVMYGGDSFKEPAPFRADLAVADDDVMDILLEAWACHESQKFEWLPPQKGLRYDQVPKDHDGRIALLRGKMMPGRLISNACRHREELDRAWGGCGPKYAEVFELCDYARKPVPKEVAYLRSLGFKWLGPDVK